MITYRLLRYGLCMGWVMAALASVRAGAPAVLPESGARRVIHVGTEHAVYDLYVGPDSRLYNLRFGSQEIPALQTEGSGGGSLTEAYPPSGTRYAFEPALSIIHADGNNSTDLEFVGEQAGSPSPGVKETRIKLRDPVYPVDVELVFRAYAGFDVIEQSSEIRHTEPGAIVLERFASSSPQMTGDLWLTQFHGDWANEMNPLSERLSPGIKVLDSKTLVRADRFRPPFFLLGVGAAVREAAGETWAGMLDWSGSFQFAFDDNGLGATRLLAGINPYGQAYRLDPGVLFATPVMRWAWSDQGVGQLSRNLHRWIRRYALRDGDRPRAVLLNNWEATGFAFDEGKIVSLFDRAKDLGMELFLLDDGWFGTRFPRNDDTQGLGDWSVNPAKLPRGISHLADEARNRGLRFGIWIEPEMVNPRSELYLAHPDWVIREPGRALELQRNQLVLDLTRPAVAQYESGVIDTLLRDNPGVSYVKWDSNRYVTQPGSSWLPKDRQSNLGIDYVRALDGLMAEVEKRHPAVEMMLCSGGGGRVDLGTLKHFDEFWPSDNTDPLRRVVMQWDYSTFFPALAISGHVTHSGGRSIKFALDVAMSARMGIDLDLSKLTPEESRQAAVAVEVYKDKLRDVVQFGDLYRMESPHSGPRSVIDYVSQDKSRAAMFVFQVADGAPDAVRPGGLDPQAKYRLSELDLGEGGVPAMPQLGSVISGTDLAATGIIPTVHKAISSQVVWLERVD